MGYVEPLWPKGLYSWVGPAVMVDLQLGLDKFCFLLDLFPLAVLLFILCILLFILLFCRQ